MVFYDKTVWRQSRESTATYIIRRRREFDKLKELSDKQLTQEVTATAESLIAAISEETAAHAEPSDQMGWHVYAVGFEKDSSSDFFGVLDSACARTCHGSQLGVTSSASTFPRRAWFGATRTST